MTDSSILLKVDSEFKSIQDVANPIMHCNATYLGDIYRFEVINFDVNAVELVNYFGHVSAE